MNRKILIICICSKLLHKILKSKFIPHILKAWDNTKDVPDDAPYEVYIFWMVYMFDGI